MLFLFLFSFRVLADNPTFHFEPRKIAIIADGEIALTDSCKALAKDIGLINKKFPQSDIKSVTGLVTWRASLCEKPPKGNGTVIQLCEAELGSGESIFFWQKKTKKGMLKPGFFICKRRFTWSYNFNSR
jgi:hypothetical protein